MKIWSVTLHNQFKSSQPGQHFYEVKDITQPFPSKTKAVAFVQHYLKGEEWEKAYDSGDVVVYRFGNNQELHVESIAVNS